MALYLGVTTANSRMLGWRVVGIGESREEVEGCRPSAEGSAHSRTEYVNFRIVSISAARRELGSGAVDHMIENFIENRDRIERVCDVRVYERQEA